MQKCVRRDKKTSMHYEMGIEEKIIFTFNKIYFDLIKDVKLLSPELKDKIKKTYKVKNYATETNISNFPLFYEQLVKSPVDTMLSIPELLDSKILQGIAVQDIVLHAKEEFLNVLRSYILILNLIKYLMIDVNEDTPVLFETIMKCLQYIQESKEFSDVVGDIFDDDVKTILSKIESVFVKNKETEDAANEAFSPENLMNTKLGSLAQEISNEIDLTGIENPADLLNFSNLTSGNNVIGNIVSKVGSKIQQKLGNGELKQEDLISEAVSMMSMMNKNGSDFMNNPLLKQMMGAMGGKNVKAHVNEANLRKMSAREKLRKKFDEKQSGKSTQ